MNKTSIPAFVESLTPDAANAKYSRAKLKMYYVGETVDHRLFTKEFSDKLLSTITYTPVVGFYSVAEEDFIGHNNVQNIYGIVPADASLEYVEDAEQGVTFAVTDIILYTGRPDETGAIAAKIVGKQHSLELDPYTVQYKINRDEAGNFKNLEFTDGELIGLSVLGDNETPAFSGSEFFSAVELPEFITEDNKNKYQALFTAMFNVQPTAEEVVMEIYRAMDNQHIYGYICEHIADEYAVIYSDYGIYNRYKLSRGEEGNLSLSLDCSVRNRYLSDAEIEALANVKKGNTENFENGKAAQDTGVIGTETTADIGSATSVGNDPEPVANATELELELETLRGNYQSLEGQNAELNVRLNELENTNSGLNEQINTINQIFRESLLELYSEILSAEVLENLTNNTISLPIEEFRDMCKQAAEESRQNTNTTVFEISQVDNAPSVYDENDEVAVVQKYKNMNRGKN